MTVPEQRDQPPEWLDRAEWTTAQAAAYVATLRAITPESGRRWLTRHGRPALTGGRQGGRDGQNLYRAAAVRDLVTAAESLTD